MEGATGPVDGVQVPQEPLDPSVGVPLQKVPLQGPVVIPLLPLPDLAPHEEELLPRVRVHVPVQETQVRELLPEVGLGHLVQHRAFHVDDLVVGEGQYEVLVERVEEREGEGSEVVLPVDRGVLDEFQHVVHPPHVPLEGEPESSQVDRPGDGRPCGRFLRYRHRSRESCVHDLVHPAQEPDRLEVLVPAELVRNPLPGISRVVEVEHGGHRVHAQAVDVVFLQPEQGARKEEVRHLPSAVVEYQRPPVPVFPFPGIGVLVEMRPVERSDPVRILREVGGNPVKEHSDSLLVAPVDEGHEVDRSAVAGRRGEIPERLVSTGTVERMLRDGEKLDVGVSHLPDVGDELVRQLPVRQVAGPMPLLPFPRSEVHLVDRNGFREKIAVAPAGHPRIVPPGVPVDVADDRSRPRRMFVPEGVGVGLEENLPRFPGTDLVLVDLLRAETGDEDLPDAAFPAVAHGVPASVPVVEIPHHGHPPGVGGPHAEGDPGHAPDLREVAAEPAVQFEMRPLPEQVDVEVGEDVAETVRILLQPPVAFVVFDLDPVGKRLLPAGKDRLDYARRMQPFHLRAKLSAARGGENECADRVREDRPDGDRFPRRQGDHVGTEDGERVPVPGLREPVDVFLAYGPRHVVHCIGNISFPGNRGRSGGKRLPYGGTRTGPPAGGPGTMPAVGEIPCPTG